MKRLTNQMKNLKLLGKARRAAMTLGMMSLLYSAAPAYAGSWERTYTLSGSNEGEYGEGDVFNWPSNGVVADTNPDDEWDTSWSLIQDGVFHTGVNGNTGPSSATVESSGTITVTFTWVPDPANPQEQPPDKMYVKETSSALARVGSVGGGSFNTEVNNGIGTEPVTLWSSSGGEEVQASGSRARQVDVGGTATFECTLKAKVYIQKWSDGMTTDLSYSAEPIRFGLSVSPDGQVPVGQTGTTGFYHGRVLWDGSTDSGGDPNPDGIRIVSPDEKEFYAVVQAKVTFPASHTPDETITVTAERIRYSNGPNNAPVPVDGTDGSCDITLTLITSATDTEGGAPVSSSDGQSKTWTYRTHDLSDTEAHRINGLFDWHITDKKGRWRLKVKDEWSNPVELKIDKRGQLTAYAMDWASYYADKRAGAADEEELDQWSTIDGPNGLWSHCFSFAGHIYNRHGLSIAGTNAGMPSAASASDDGSGSLRFYWSNQNPPTSPTDPGHVGLIGPNTMLGYATRIDNNGLPADSTGFNGPMWRGKDEGVASAYMGYGSNREPVSRTLPGVMNPAVSLLQELDGE